MANGYTVDYSDKRFAQVDAQKDAAIKESNSMYDNMINQSDSYFQSQIDAVNQYGETQKQNQQAQTDFTIEKIEQQKDQAHKDYLKEQSASYVDWQKQINQYGANAEQMAASGMANTGYSESSQVAMYNQYQNRVASARETYNKAVLNYDNAITEARLQNNSLLAEIAYNTLRTSLELSLQGFQYKNTLVLDKVNAKRELDKDYYSRRQDIVSQINTENAMAEQIRSNKAQEAHQKATLAEQIRQYNQDYNLKLKQYNESIRQFNVEIARLKANDAVENKVKIQQLENQKQELQLQRDKLKEDKRQFDLSYQLQKKNSSVSGSGGSGYYLVDESESSGGGDTNPKKDGRTTATRDDESTKKPVEGSVLGKGAPLKNNPSGRNAEELAKLYQSIGMNRSVEGRIEAIQKLYNEGNISEQEALELLEYYGNKPV